MSNGNQELEQLVGTGILIAGEPLRKITSGTVCQLNVTAQFADEGNEELNAKWFRSLFLTCTSKNNQSVASVNLLKSQAIFPGDIKKTTVERPMIFQTLNLNLAKELGRELVKDSYYITISARQFISNTVIVEVM